MIFTTSTKKSFFLTIILTMTCVLFAETHVGGIVKKNERWSAQKGPYVIMSDLLIPPNVQLTIGPGTVILIGKPVVYDTIIKQFDYTDTHMVSITIKGMLSCIGKRNDRITIRPATPDAQKPTWYGIVFDGAFDDIAEIAFTDISGACFGVKAKSCRPIIRNTTLERNNIGIQCDIGGSARIYNTIITQNFTSGIHSIKANPIICNSIIAFNWNIGIWGDNKSTLTCTYNCIFENGDGNFIDCNPELGAIIIQKKSTQPIIPTDIFNNILANPVFLGSSADTLAQKSDVKKPTSITDMINPTLGKILGNEKKSTTEITKSIKPKGRFALSEYSPCINRGKPGAANSDIDGSRNDMGIYGGPDVFSDR